MSEIELEALRLSFLVAASGTLVALPPGILCAWILARYHFPGKVLLDGLIHLPLVVPPIVTGYVLLILLGRSGPVGSFLYTHFGITLGFNWKGAAIVACVMGFPLMVRAIRLSIEAMDMELPGVARTLGATPGKTFCKIILPLTAPGIISGSLLAFARALGEFGATITFVGNIPGQTQTLPLALYALLQTPEGEAAALRIVIVSLLLAFLALGIAGYAGRVLTRRMGGQAA